MSKKLPILVSQQKLLWGRARSLCSICRCRLDKEKESGEFFTIGINAHIKGENPTAARFDPNMSDKERQNYDNLILLCPTHHEEIDKHPEKFTVSSLQQIKKRHEEFILDSIASEIPNLTFAELEIILKYLTGLENLDPSTDYDALEIERKLKHNGLGKFGKLYISMGLSNFQVVQEFINTFHDPNYSVRLKNGFKDKYIELKKGTGSSEEIFYDLLDFSSGNSHDPKLIAAGVSVLAYYFQICEVFEK
nr:ABC-three component system protein [uncultured Methanoregula sp.]